jgi:hypothetical protein
MQILVGTVIHKIFVLGLSSIYIQSLHSYLLGQG